MKKFLIIGLLVLLTGCGSNNIKTLTCSTSTEKDGMKMDITLKSDWKEDTLHSLVLETSYQLETSLESEKRESFKTYVDSTMASWNDMSGVKYDSTMKNNQFLMSLTIDASKGKKALKEFGIDTEKTTYDSLKQGLEEDKYICK